MHDAPQPLVQIVADVPRAFEAIVAKLLAKDPKLRYPSAGALRDDLRRFRNGEPVQALAAAATAQGMPLPAGAAASTGAISAAVAAGATTVGPSIPPRSGSVPQTGMYEAGYPLGASPDAMYYDSGSSRTGWYALAAFVALIALVVGGVLLFQSLNQGDAADAEPTSFELADYTNRPRADVVAELDALGFTFTTQAEENGDFGIDFVIRTEPPAGTIVIEGQPIVVFYNPDPQVTPIPNVVGVPLDEARVILESAGFAIGTITIEQTDQFEEGTVLSMTPIAETQANAGDPVDLVVAGPPESVSVPGFLIGQTEQAAIDVLQGEPYGFVVTVTRVSSSSIAAGTVLDISPAANTLVARGGEITLTVSDGPEPITVPPLKGQTEGRARNALTAAGLQVAVQYEEVFPGSPDDGRVTNQSIESGALVDPGTVVTLTVGRSTRIATTLPPATAPPATAAPTTAPPATTPPPAPTTPPDSTSPPTTTV